MVLSQVLQSLVTFVHWRDTLRIFAAALFLNSFCGILYDANLTQGHISSSSDEEEGRHRENSKSFTLHCSVWKVPGFLLLTACSFFFYVCSHYKLRPLGKIWALPISVCKRSLPFLMVDATICNQAFRGRPFDFWGGGGGGGAWVISEEIFCRRISGGKNLECLLKETSCIKKKIC